MSINKHFANREHAVSWSGEEAANLRGLTPNDVVQIITLEGVGMFDMLSLRDKLDMSGIDLSNTDAVADQLMQEGPQALAEIGLKVPTLLARIIAVAAGCGDDDEAVEAIRTGFPLPLQVECLAQIARLTFVGPEGFRQFVGNVMALMATLSAVLNVNPRKPTTASPVLGSGSLAFANSVPGSVPAVN